MHMPIGDRARARRCSRRATAVITTSDWTRRRLGELYGLPAEQVHVAEPGVDAAGLAPGTAAGDALLCVAAVTPGKGHDVLLDALATATDLPWRCTLRGQPRSRPGVRRRRAPRARDDGLGDRVRFPGPRTGPELDRAYAAADLLVLASHAETYGMVVTEALARGVPVLATDVGGVREALGRRDGTGRGCSSRPATRRRSAPRCGAGSRRRAARAAAPGRAAAARGAAPVGRTRRRTSPASWRRRTTLAGAAR